ncbi:histidine kinase [Streptomyces sp. NPDC050997]|uniref:sensor histidine kinase n=1 Tax=Streptomyces sp. NPDC050997 TaxID=3155519 RepID=UPI0034387CA3
MPRGFLRSDRQQRDTLPPQLAFAIVLVVLCGFVLIAVLNVIGSDPGPWLLAACLFSSVALFAIQTVHSYPGTERFRERYGLWTLLGQAVLTYVPMLFFSVTWGGMGGFLAGSSLLIITAPACWVAFGVIVAVTGLAAVAEGTGWVDSSYLVVSTVLTGLIVYGLTRLSNLVAEVHRAREELAEMAVARERLRFARDLHDLLGFGLSAITLKSELTFRLVATRPERAREELVAILQISRQALADVRSVARGYREMSLDAEAASAEDVLTAAEIEARIDLDCGPVSARAGTVLATVIREGVTNVLRHSKAQNCVIEAHPASGPDGPLVRLVVANDGADETRRTGSQDGGSGLGNLRTRVEEIGGRLTAGADDAGWFRLTAEVPRTPASAPQPNPSHS